MIKKSEYCDAFIPNHECIIYGNCKGADLCRDYEEDPHFGEEFDFDGEEDFLDDRICRDHD